jgi:hypothetical protein
MSSQPCSKPNVVCIPFFPVCENVSPCHPVEWLRCVGQGRLLDRLVSVLWVCAPDHVPDLQRWPVRVVMRWFSKFKRSFYTFKRSFYKLESSFYTFMWQVYEPMSKLYTFNRPLFKSKSSLYTFMWQVYETKSSFYKTGRPFYEFSTRFMKITVTVSVFCAKMSIFYGVVW